MENLMVSAPSLALSDEASQLVEFERVVVMVAEYRERLKSRWATPSLIDCLYFAVTEIGEACDAVLRQSPLYNRNSMRSVNVGDEFVDTLMMLASAAAHTGIPTGVEVPRRQSYGFDRDLPAAIMLVGELPFLWRHGQARLDLSIVRAALATMACYEYWSEDVRLLDRLRSRLEHIKERVMPYAAD